MMHGSRAAYQTPVPSILSFFLFFPNRSAGLDSLQLAASDFRQLTVKPLAKFNLFLIFSALIEWCVGIIFAKQIDFKRDKTKPENLAYLLHQ